MAKYKVLFDSANFGEETVEADGLLVDSDFSVLRLYKHTGGGTTETVALFYKWIYAVREEDE